MLVQGRGSARVDATGTRTELGKIGKALQTVETDETFLQKKSARMIRNFAAVGLALCALAVILYGLTRGNWIQGWLAGIALAMSLLPEEIPVVLTVFLALGAWRMSQKRSSPAGCRPLETLGAATVLCVDKTGTLTQNRMSVSRLYAAGEFYEVDGAKRTALPQKFHELARVRRPRQRNRSLRSDGEAFKAWATLSRYCAIHRDWTWSTNIPCRRSCWRCPMFGSRLATTNTDRGQRALPKRSPTFATSR